MATTTSQISWKAFEQLPDDGSHLEVIEGELISLPPPKSRHSKIAKRIARALNVLEENNTAIVYLEAGFKLSENPVTWIQPDVSVLATARDAATSLDGYFEGAPELAVEVVSPSETERSLNRKIKALLAGGSLAVWVVHPIEKTVQVYAPGVESITLGIQDSLTFLGLDLPIARIFED